MSGFNLSALAVRERAVTLFLLIALTGAGFFAFEKLGRAEDPAFTVKVMVVSATWPGATTDEMQRQVADPLEKRLQELVFYDRVETTVRPGLMLMKVIFKDNMPPAKLQAEFYQARKKLSDQASSLPRGVLGPLFNDEFSDIYFALYALQAKDLPHRQLVMRAEDLRQRLLRVPGVEKINILGEQAQKIFVEISYQRLATLGITGQQLLAALANQNDVTPAGFVEAAGPRVYLRLDGAIDGLDAVRNLPVAAGDRSFKLGDIAEVKRGYEDPKTFAIRNDGEPALMLGLVMKPGFNGLSLGAALDAEEVAIYHDTPVGIAFTKITDQAKVIDEAIHEFMVKFFTALGVVIVVSLAALGFRVGIVVALAVPLTLSAVFVVMMITGRDFDRITLGALIISLGLLVDDAIIAIEMMVVRMEEGADRIEAATHAWSATAAPMLTGTLVTIAGFLPVGFAASTAGEYAGNIFWVVAFSLIISWIVAVTFTPYLGVKLLPNIRRVEGGHDAIYATRNYQRLRRIVRMSVDHKWMAAGITVALFAGAVVAMGKVEQQFFPNSERAELIVEVTLPAGSAFATTEASVKRLESALRTLPEAGEITSYIGQGMPRFVLSFDPELPDPAFAQIVVQSADAHARDSLRTKVRKLVDEGRFPEARVRVLQIVFGPPIRFPVAFRVVGPNLDVIRGIAAEVSDVMAANPNMRMVHLDWGDKTPNLHLALDQERLRLIGLTPKEAGQQLQSYLNGMPATQVRENLRSVDVLLRSPGPERRSLGEIGDLTLATKDGRQVPLSQVARLESRSEDSVLKRYNRESYIRVQGDILDGKQPPDVHAQIFPLLEPIKAKLPPGYRINTAGAVEESAKAMMSLVAVFPIMLIVTLTVIMIQVRSFSTMFMVFATAPLGLVGAAPTLLVFHQPFGFNAILGLIALSGILMRNTLLLVDQIHHDRVSGLSDYEAIVESTVRRARPVFLTAAAAMLAFIPLTHSVFWGALAYVLIGGVGVGTVLTLLFLPALYALWFRVERAPTGERASRGAASMARPAVS
ncbi:efflux RND transporter permease subunit [Methylobacterium sp. E-045]|uniref:efflux RND transporter permease subunit n=1 Tax=Methylobacterium sp. E-045 TaxID=2836575 RepID=UPI001FB8A11A|nr:efflux RND transporter permease subunit [Methylobacterium sp. E-045]MCJ2128669.1 efflux RND transporter permease subunit [Methylobacterium sp. E-045]